MKFEGKRVSCCFAVWLRIPGVRFGSRSPGFWARVSALQGGKQSGRPLEWSTNANLTRMQMLASNGHDEWDGFARSCICSPVPLMAAKITPPCKRSILARVRVPLTRRAARPETQRSDAKKKQKTKSSRAARAIQLDSIRIATGELALDTMQICIQRTQWNLFL